MRIRMLILVIIGAAVRLYLLGAHSLWLDEMGQVIAASGPLQSVFNAVASHLSPPLDYLITHVVVWFGRADWLVRLPSFLFGVAAIPVMFVLARKIFDEETATVAALLLAFSPMAIAYAQEARMYSLFLLLALISYWTLLKLTEERRTRWALVLGLVNGMMLLTHYFAVFVIAGEAVFLFGGMIRSESSRRNALWVLLGFGITAAMFIPWLPYLSLQIHSSGGQIAYALPLDKDFLKFILNDFSVHTGSEEGGWYYGYIGVFVIGVIVAVLKKEKRVAASAVAVILTIVLLYLLSWYRPIVTTRNLIFLLPLYLLVCARGLQWALSQARIKADFGLALIGLLLVLPVYNYHSGGRPDFKPNWKEAAVFLNARLTTGEKVYIPDAVSRGSLAYYLEPASEHVYGRSGCVQAENKSGDIIWCVNSPINTEIKTRQRHGWFVLPPNLSGVADREEVIRSAGLAEIQPALELVTQGKGKPLQIFRF